MQLRHMCCGKVKRIGHYFQQTPRGERSAGTPHMSVQPFNMLLTLLGCISSLAAIDAAAGAALAQMTAMCAARCPALTLKSLHCRHAMLGDDHGNCACSAPTNARCCSWWPELCA
jgi:hypothetical protein